MSDDPMEIVLEHLSVLRLEPGDTLVFRVKEQLSMDRAERITAVAKMVLGNDVKVLILDGGMELEVLRGEEG